MRSVTFSCGKVVFDELTGIMRVTFEPSTHMTLELAKEQLRAMRSLLAGQAPPPVLVGLTPIKTADHQARAYFGGPEFREVFRACAMVTGGAVGNAIGNIFLAVYGKRTNPIRLFTREADALQWLRQFQPSSAAVGGKSSAG